MKKLILILICVPFISIGQTVTPKIDRYYITSDAGYSGCKDEYTLKLLFKYSSEKDNDNFMKHHDNGDCIVISGGLRVKVVNITYGGTVVELKYDGIKSSLWTVREVLREN